MWRLFYFLCAEKVYLEIGIDQQTGIITSIGESFTYRPRFVAFLSGFQIREKNSKTHQIPKFSVKIFQGYLT